MSCSSLKRREERLQPRLKVRGVEYVCGETISEINAVILTEDHTDKLRLAADKGL